MKPCDKPSDGIFSHEMPPPSVFVPIFRPKPGEEMRFIALNSTIEVVWLHWINTRTAPCIGEEAGCPYCNDQIARWTGFLGVLQVGTWKQGILELSAEAVRRCPQCNPIIHLRGRTLTYKRLPGRENARCVLAIGDLSPMLDRVPPEFDVRGFLRRLWHGYSPVNDGEA